jgi:PAS domain S-box-containing protein
MTPFRDWKIRTKLISLTLVLVLVPLVVVAYLSTDRFDNALRSAAEQDLEHLVRNIYAMCEAQAQMVQLKVSGHLNVARYVLFGQGRKLQAVAGETVRVEAVDPTSGGVIPVDIPLWKLGETRVTFNPYLVDQVQELVGGICTIFQGVDGGRLLRIATNVRDRDGRRAVGTFIPPESPVSQAILNARPYSGRAFVLDAWYFTAYEPLLDDEGRVMGALNVGVKEQSATSLRDQVKGIQVGKTGYVFIMDSSGTPSIHPAKEGESIIDARDSSGFEYIRAMIREATGPGNEGAIHTIRYPWVNPELGETRPRQKVTKYIYFRPWDWIIAAGTYEEEIYQSLHDTERFIIIVVLISLPAVFFFTIALSNLLTRPIHDLTRATTRMLDGDLSQRVDIQGGDEVGMLGHSFNRMAAQIEDYTTNLQRMVEERTRELRESRERHKEISRFLNSILESATQYAIMALDYHGKITEFNRGAENLFGWRKDEVVGRENIGITITPEDRDAGIQKEMSRRTRSEGVCELEMARVRKDGSVFPAHSVVTAIQEPSGEVTGFVEVVRDLTVRRMLQRQLQETKEFLENVMESSVDGIVTTDLKGYITYLNRGMEEMLQYRREALLNTHISTLYVQGIDQAREVMAILRARDRIENYEMLVRRHDGAILSIMNSASLLRSGEGQLIGTVGVFKDVTEHKRLEAKLKETQAHLIEASKLRALGELVSGVAHELNNPLMASQTILHVLLANLHQDCPNKDRLEIIRKCNDRIEKIVDHLREFSRQAKPEFQPLDVNQTIGNALLITGQQLLDHAISLVRDLTDGLPRVLADPNQIEQVFLNLISNARDALDEVDGPKALTIRSYLETRDGNDWVVVSFRDTGPGIPKEILDKVLEPFFTTKPVGRGTGLGLSLCFKIVEDHGGRLEIHSEVGIGTEVKIVLPQAPP